MQSLHIFVSTRRRDIGPQHTAIVLTHVCRASNVQYLKSHDLALKEHVTKQFTYRQTSLPERPARSNAHTDLSARCGTCMSLSLSNLFALAAPDQGCQGWTAYHAAEKNGCDNACVSEDCNMLARCTLQGVGGARARR